MDNLEALLFVQVNHSFVNP